MIKDAIEFFGDRFLDYFLGCYENGYIISNQRLILMARPVLSTDTIERIRDPWVKYDMADMWYVHYASGPIEEMIRQIPIDLPLLGYEHHGRLRFLRMQKILNHYGRLD